MIHGDGERAGVVCSTSQVVHRPLFCTAPRTTTHHHIDNTRHVHRESTITLRYNNYNDHNHDTAKMKHRHTISVHHGKKILPQWVTTPVGHSNSPHTFLAIAAQPQPKGRHRSSAGEKQNAAPLSPKSRRQGDDAAPLSPRLKGRHIDKAAIGSPTNFTRVAHVNDPEGELIHALVMHGWCTLRVFQGTNYRLCSHVSSSYMP